MDNDDEAIKLMLVNSDSQDKVETPIQNLTNSLDTKATSTEVPYTDDDNSKNDSTMDSESEDEWFDALTSLPEPLPNLPVAQPSSIQPHPQLPDSYIPPVEIVKEALCKKGNQTLQKHFQRTCSLYLTNTGGQMEFQEVLPLLVSGPSMFFFTFRLDRDLNERYVIEYDLFDGTKADPYTSTLTMLEGLLQTLATIAAMGTYAVSYTHLTLPTIYSV